MSNRCSPSTFISDSYVRVSRSSSLWVASASAPSCSSSRRVFSPVIAGSLSEQGLWLTSNRRVARALTLHVDDVAQADRLELLRLDLRRVRLEHRRDRADQLVELRDFCAKSGRGKSSAGSANRLPHTRTAGGRAQAKVGAIGAAHSRGSPCTPPAASPPPRTASARAAGCCSSPARRRAAVSGPVHPVYTLGPSRPPAPAAAMTPLPAVYIHGGNNKPFAGAGTYFGRAVGRSGSAAGAASGARERAAAGDTHVEHDRAVAHAGPACHCRHRRVRLIRVRVFAGR